MVLCWLCLWNWCPYRSAVILEPICPCAPQNTYGCLIWYRGKYFQFDYLLDQRCVRRRVASTGPIQCCYHIVRPGQPKFHAYMLICIYCYHSMSFNGCSYSTQLNISAWTLSYNFVLGCLCLHLIWLDLSRFILHNWFRFFVDWCRVYWLLLLSLLLLLRSMIVLWLCVWLEQICLVLLFFFHFLFLLDWFGVLFWLGCCLVSWLFAFLPTACNGWLLISCRRIWALLRSLVISWLGLDYGWFSIFLGWLFVGWFGTHNRLHILLWLHFLVVVTLVFVFFVFFSFSLVLLLRLILLANNLVITRLLISWFCCSWSVVFCFWILGTWLLVCRRIWLESIMRCLRFYWIRLTSIFNSWSLGAC